MAQESTYTFLKDVRNRRQDGAGRLDYDVKKTMRQKIRDKSPKERKRERENVGLRGRVRNKITASAVLS
jgi:hypothetical protein